MIPSEVQRIICKSGHLKKSLYYALILHKMLYARNLLNNSAMWLHFRSYLAWITTVRGYFVFLVSIHRAQEKWVCVSSHEPPRSRSWHEEGVTKFLIVWSLTGNGNWEWEHASTPGILYLDALIVFESMNRRITLRHHCNCDKVWSNLNYEKHVQDSFVRLTGARFACIWAAYPFI